MEQLTEKVKGLVCEANRVAAECIETILVNYSIKFKRAAGLYRICCPACGDHKFNISIVTARQANMSYFTPFFKCWKCGIEKEIGSSITALISKLRNCSVNHAISIIHGIAKNGLHYQEKGK